LQFLVHLKFQAPRNEISEFSENFNFPKLEELDLDSNRLVSWVEVCRLSKLPNLHTLHLNSNQIHSIQMPDTQALSKLQTLFLSGNRVSDWASVSALGCLPALAELSFKDNPVLKAESPETNRQIIICRLDRLHSLDKVQVTRVEKRGAAFDYLKRYGLEFLQSKSNIER
jgi:Leucine-rich repeat (LRR) protein